MYEIWGVPLNGDHQVIVGMVNPVLLGSVIALDQAIEKVMASASQQGYRDIALRYRFVALHQAEAQAVPTTTAELRTALANGFDRLLGMPRLMVGADQRALIYALGSYFQAADDATLQKLLNLIPRG